jgi:hypothetical protein
MKISSYYKNKGFETKLLEDYNNLDNYDKIYLSKVFSFTKIPINLSLYPNIEFGGTGFYFDKAPDLPYEIEHQKPDYNLYDDYIKKELQRGIKQNKFSNYFDYSIGFATRGCFRKCEFCVNKKYNTVIRHSKISEFFDASRKYIYLCDDNFLGYNKWNEVLDELEETNRPFQFKQGLDLRIMTDEKAERLSKMKYKGEFIFAFDYIKDKTIIEDKLILWKKYSNKIAKLYILCAYDSQDSIDIENTFERIKILMKYKCLPYIMRYETYKNSKYIGIYINLAAWCNQPNFFKKTSFREFCEVNGVNSSTYKYMLNFEKDYPEIAKKYYDLKFENNDKE